MPNGATSLILNVNRNNLAKSFYEKMGFIKVGTRTFELTTGVMGQDFIYHLPLSAV